MPRFIVEATVLVRTALDAETPEEAAELFRGTRGVVPQKVGDKHVVGTCKDPDCRRILLEGRARYDENNNCWCEAHNPYARRSS